MPSSPPSSPTKADLQGHEQMTEQQMTEEPKLLELTEEEVAKHNTAEDCWLIIGGPGERLVYDVTKYLDDHPGGPEIMLDLAGQNATDEFEDIGHSNDARAKMKEFVIGKLKEEVTKSVTKASSNHSNGANSVAANGGSSSMGPLFILVAIVVALLGFFLHLKSSRTA